MKKLSSLLLVMLILCGCSANNTDDAGSAPHTDYPAAAFDIELSKCPQTIVSLSPEVTDIILALGNEAQLVGVSDNCDIDKEIERYGTSAMPDIEAIKKAKPDLVFVSGLAYEGDIEILTNAKIKVAKVKSATDYIELSALYNDIAVLISGEITGVRNAANTFTNIDGQIKSASNSHSISVKAAVFVDDKRTLESDCIAATLVGFAGIDKLIGGSDEKIIKAKPDVILCPKGRAADFTVRFKESVIREFDPVLLEGRGFKMADLVNEIISVLEE